MNLRQLNYFTRIVEAQNMTRAAEMLHIAQPALSQQITLLEEELGVKLLNRTARGMLATEEGELLYQHARAILRQVDNTRALISRKQGLISGTVSIGMASSTARMLALRLIELLRARHPAIVLEIVDVPSADLTSMVMQGRVDFALAPDPKKPKGMHCQPLLFEDLYLFTHPSLRHDNSPVSLEEMARHPLVLPSLPNTLRSRIEHAFLQRHLSYHLLAEASTSAILIPAVKAGIATTVLPYSAGHDEVQLGSIAMHPLAFELSREICLCVSETLPISVATREVLGMCSRLATDLVLQGVWQGCRVINHSGGH
ncbi:LysR substrate-binding domain-containing protein [Castellaniella sp.]|uniref:LysR substrate-binding domain-containing protein n=1 Tax=Castellaniella sp. TaxID=1955812 RepID=UPI003C71FA56